MYLDDRRQPDIKKRSGFLSISGWFQDDKPENTLFSLCKSFKTKNNEYQTYTIKINQNQLEDLIFIGQQILEQNERILFLRNNKEEKHTFYS